MASASLYSLVISYINLFVIFCNSSFKVIIEWSVLFQVLILSFFINDSIFRLQSLFNHRSTFCGCMLCQNCFMYKSLTSTSRANVQYVTRCFVLSDICYDLNIRESTSCISRHSLGPFMNLLLFSFVLFCFKYLVVHTVL